MDRFDAMRSYVQIVDSGSFTQAARQLKLHKATLSQQIRRLEDELGTRLLTRTTRSVAPTAEGAAYYQHSCEMLQQVDEMETKLRKGTHAPAGRLRVDVPVAMGRLVFAPEIRHFLDRYPRISVELGCSDRAVDLMREGLDCALRGGSLPDSRLAARPVGHLRFVLCAAPRYIDECGLPDTPEALTGHRQIGFVGASTGQLRPIRLSREERVVEVDIPARLVITDSASVLIAGLDGLGIIQIAEFVARHYLASGALISVLPGWQCASLPLHLVTPTARKRTARVQVFMDWAHALLTRRLGSALDGR